MKTEGRGQTVSLRLFLTGNHPCAYLPGLEARTLFVDPFAPIDGARYQFLLEHGFRRSGTDIYRPECAGCRRCVPVRIPVEDFSPNRSQRRNAARNMADLTLTKRPARFDPGHFRLYAAYLRSRHPGGGMSENITRESYEEFLLVPWGGETQLLEIRLSDRLAAVAVTDLLPRSLSAVYTFFDPDLSTRALGTYAVLSQIAQARRIGRKHLYLGYWIESCGKMSYKDRFRPIEAFVAEQWRRVSRGELISSP